MHVALLNKPMAAPIRSKQLQKQPSAPRNGEKTSKKKGRVKNLKAWNLIFGREFKTWIFEMRDVSPPTRNIRLFHWIEPFALGNEQIWNIWSRNEYSAEYVFAFEL